MQVSLNKLVQMLSDRVGQPFNRAVQAELKTIINYKRADWFQKVLDAHPEQRKNFLKDFSAELQVAEKAECPIVFDCKLLRTVHPIPAPLRTAFTLFDYVGDPDKIDAYSYTTPDQLYWILKYGAKYTHDRPRYFYINGYIFIYNDRAIEYINVRGVWPDQRQLVLFKCEDQPCYTDDDQYDIPDDIINTMMQDIIKNELRLFMPNPSDAIVETTTKNKQQ